MNNTAFQEALTFAQQVSNPHSPYGLCRVLGIEIISLSEDKTVYYGHTCLTTEMAYNNARLIARPDSYWLQP